MPRGLRGKSGSSKSNKNEEDRIQDEHVIQNGGITDQTIDSIDLSPQGSPVVSKRPLPDDSGSNSNPPPIKKRHIIEIDSLRDSACKRPHKNNDKSEQNRAKIPKIDVKLFQNSWTSVTNINNDQTINSNSNNQQNNFVVASYNISSMNHDSQHHLLMEELTFIDADILCLQNINKNYWGNLEKSLKDRGYCGQIILNGESNGLATLYRTSRFIQLIVDSDKLSKLCLEHINRDNSLDDRTLASIKEYIDEPEPYIVTVLKDIKNNRILLVGNTRLCNDNTDKSDLKCVQAVAIFWHIHNIICQLKSDYANNNHHQSSDTDELMTLPCWILCGDFNGSIDSPVYQICHDGYPNEASIDALQSVKKLMIADNSNYNSLVNIIWHSFQHPFPDSKNSYFRCRNSGSDYIWMSDRALCTNRVLLSTSSCSQTVTGDIETSNVINKSFSNDHLFLACEVNFVT